jgi:hypothetical protein
VSWVGVQPGYWRFGAGMHGRAPGPQPGYETHRSNARPVPWPNYNDLLDYLELNNYPRLQGQDSAYPRNLIWALDGAVSRIAERCDLDVRVPTEPIEWQVRTFEGLATILGRGEYRLDRVGADVSGAGIPHGTKLEEIAAPNSAYLSKTATLTSADTGITLCVGAGVETPDQPALVSPQVFDATLLQAARWYKRRQAVEGVIGASELGGVIRYSALDSDVEGMLANDLIYGLA